MATNIQEALKQALEKTRREEEAQRRKLESDVAWNNAHLASLNDRHKSFLDTKRTVDRNQKGESITDWQSVDREINELLNTKAAAYNSEWKICMLNYFGMIASVATAITNETTELFMYNGREALAANGLNNAKLALDLDKMKGLTEYLNDLTPSNLLDMAKINDGRLYMEPAPGKPALELHDKFQKILTQWLEEEHKYTQTNGVFEQNGTKLEQTQFDQLVEKLKVKLEDTPAPENDSMSPRFI